LPVRYNWAAEYRGRAIVVCGHTPVPEPEWLNRTINIDTGCVFGGKLTALRYPEKELVSVPAARVYAHSAKPLRPAADGVPALTAQQQHDDVLDIEDVMGEGKTWEHSAGYPLTKRHCFGLWFVTPSSISPLWL